TANGATLACNGSNQVSFDDGGGAGTISGPGGTLDCNEVNSITVDAQGGADVVDLTGVLKGGDYVNLGVGSGGSPLSIRGGGGGHPTDTSLDFRATIDGGAAGDTITGSSQSDLILPGIGDDSVAGAGGVGDNDTISYSDAPSGVNASLSGSASGGGGNDTFS